MTIWTVLLFLASCLVSIFSHELRLLFQKGGRGIGAMMLKSDQDVLKQLHTLHDDAYNLVLWVCLQFRAAMLETLVIAVITFILWSERGTPGVIPVLNIVFGLVVGAWISVWLRVFNTLTRLEDYDKSIARIQKRIDAFEDTNFGKSTH